MTIIDVRSNIAEALKLTSRVSKQLRPVAIVRALNRTGQMAYTESARAIRARGYNVKVGKIKANISKRGANVSSLEYRLKAMNKVIDLKEFGAKGRKVGKLEIKRGRAGQIKSLSRKSAGVSVNVKGGRKLLRHAFIGPNGHVYQRVKGSTGKGSFMSNGFQLRGAKIKKMSGPSVADMIDDNVVNATLERFVIIKFKDRLAHEVSRLLGR